MHISNILAQVGRNAKIEQEIEDLRRQQEHDLNELERARREMETGDVEVRQKRPKWNDHTRACAKQHKPKKI